MQDVYLRLICQNKVKGYRINLLEVDCDKDTLMQFLDSSL